MTKSAYRALGVLAAGALLSFSASSSAHGGIPRAYQILFEPGNAKHIVLRSDLWGFFDSRDGGDTWSYVCAEAWGGVSSALQNRTLAIMPGGRMLIATHFDGLKVTDDLCTWRRLPAFEDENVPLVVAGPDSPDTVYTVTSTGNDVGIKNQLWRSSDRGETWTAFGPELATDFAPSSLAFAPSNAKRMYLAGNVTEHGGARMLVSSDGGTSWQSFTLPITRTDNFNPRIVVIHPTRPDVVLLRVDGEEGYGENIPDEIWATTDAGKTWSTIFTSEGDLPGTAFDPATENLFISGPLDGVKSAPLDAALSTRQGAFQPVLGGQAFGLRITPDGLLIGGDNYGARGVPEYTLGASTDQAKTVNTVMTMCDLELAACAPNTTVGERCGPIWGGDETTQGFHTEYIEPRCVPDSGGTGGMSGAGGTGAGGTGAGGTGAGAVGGVSAAGASGEPNSTAGGHSRGIDGRSSGCSCTLPSRTTSTEAGILSAIPLLGALVRFSRRRRRITSPDPKRDCTQATHRACASLPRSASDRTEA